MDETIKKKKERERKKNSFQFHLRSPLRDRLLFFSSESSRNFHPFSARSGARFHPGTRQRCVTAGSKSILRNIETPEGMEAREQVRRKRSDAEEERDGGAEEERRENDTRGRAGGEEKVQKERNSEDRDTKKSLYSRRNT